MRRPAHAHASPFPHYPSSACEPTRSPNWQESSLIYNKYAREFMAGLNFPQKVVEGMDVTADLTFSTLVVDEHSSRLGAHRDPAAPLPALIAGQTVHKYVTGQWCATARGGRLILLDGLFDLSYGPRDAVLLDGSFLHAVTRLRGMPTPPSVSVPPLERRSFIIFNRFRREKRIPAAQYVGEWREEWLSSVLWLPGHAPVTPKRRRTKLY